MTAHSRFGYSATHTYEQCPHRYKLQYLDGIEQETGEALILGTALHRGIETDADTAIREFYETAPVITDWHITQEIALRYWINLIKEFVPENAIHEYTVRYQDFIGTLDMLVPVEDGVYDLYDWKYTNNSRYYTDSTQLHIYKFFFEEATGNKIRDMYFVFAPKYKIYQRKNETLQQFRNRLESWLRGSRLEVIPVEYDLDKVWDYYITCGKIQKSETDKKFLKNPSHLCKWCGLCKQEEIDMLPSTTRVEVDNERNFKKIWIYGAPFSGKTFCADTAPTPLNLNTDGNVKYVTMPRLAVKDTLDGRQTVPAWEVFKGAVDELSQGSDFETIVVDLLEDVYDYARIYICKKRGWEHESDDSFKAYEICRNEFLRELRRLLNLPYNIILISHEDASKDITKRGGDKTTAIKPNIADKVAVKIAGMVDIVLRAEKDGDSYTLSTKTNSVVFGGGRLSGLKADDIPNTWESIEAMYNGTLPDTETGDRRRR